MSDNAPNNNTYTYEIENSGNYPAENITANVGTLSINCKAVTLTADDASKVYDGTALTKGTFTATALEEGDDHTFTVVMTEESTITAVGTQPNVIATVDGVDVTEGEQPIAVGNYCVTTANGELEITANEAAIVITSATTSWTYNNALHKDETYTVTYNGTAVEADSTGKVFTLPTNDTITITATAEGVKFVSDTAENNTADEVDCG